MLAVGRVLARQFDLPVLDAIDWDEVLTPPGDLAAATRALIPPAATLAAAELEGMASAIRDRPELWEPLLVVDAHRRRYRLLYEDERTDIWVLCWMPGQSTGFHDHDVSDVGIAIARGKIIERQLLLPTGATALELAASGTAPLGTVLPAMLGVHALIGLGEAAVTVAAVGAVLASRPDLVAMAPPLRGPVAPNRPAEA